MKKIFAIMLVVGAFIVAGCSGSEPSADDAKGALKGAKTVEGGSVEGSGGGQPVEPK